MEVFKGGSLTKTAATNEVTALLLAWSQGQQSALDKLMPLVHVQLRRLAHSYMKEERPGHLLQTTALVNEAYLRLIDSSRVQWRDRAHFYAIAAQLMRRILVDSARSRRYLKRGGKARILSFEDAMDAPADEGFDLLALDEALTQLASLDARKAQAVELRFFGGLTVEETARVLGISAETVMRDWRLTKAWLVRALGGCGGAPGDA